jgi:predicted transcriptional regulator
MKRIKEKSLFLEQFGDTPRLRVMDFMVGNHFFDFPLTEIARESHISYNSLKSFIGKFVETGFLIKTRRIRKSDYYQLNLKNTFVLNLIKIDWALTKSYILSMKEEVIPAH